MVSSVPAEEKGGITPSWQSLFYTKVNIDWLI